MKLLLLYTELAGYTVSCIKEFLKHDNNNIVTIIRYPINNEAPFNFSENDSRISLIKVQNVNKSLIIELIKNHDLTLCSGWIDKTYLRAIKESVYCDNVSLMLDNPWKQSFRQILGSFWFKIFYKNNFKYAFVAGNKQSLFAQKLGFLPNRIFKGLYSADNIYFNSVYYEKQKQSINKRFVYCGRYTKDKGINDLCNAFILSLIETNHDWELWCCGTGELYVNRILHPKIRHFGFIQPSDIKDIMLSTDIYVMPSISEPWGVSLHEFTCAGFPVIVSDRVNSQEVFFKEKINGYSFRAGNINDLKNCILRYTTMNDKSIINMGQKSNEFSKNLSVKMWVDTIYKMNI